MKILKPLSLLLILAIAFYACDKKKNGDVDNKPTPVDSTNIQGYNILSKLPGI